MQGFRLDQVSLDQTLRKLRQAIGNLVIGVRSPKSHEPCQLFFREAGFKPGLCRLTRQFGIEHVLTGLAALGHRTRFAEFLRKVPRPRLPPPAPG